MDAIMVGQRIRKLRKKNHMRQEDLAAHLGVRKTSISNYETGYSFPKRSVLMKLSKLFGVSMDYLCSENDDPEPEALLPNEAHYIMQEIPQCTFDPLQHLGLLSKYEEQTAAISKHSARGASFSVIVPDDGMDRLRLHEGDEVLVRQQDFAEHGQIILAYLPQKKKIVIRRYFQTGKLVTLMPDSTQDGYEPLLLDAVDDQFQLLGVIAGAVIYLD